MAFQSEIELRVKVIDKELNELEKRIQKVQNPFSASGASKGSSKAELRQRQVLLNVDKNRLELQQRLKADQIRQLNITNNWLKVLRQGEEVRKDIAKAAEREAKATQKTAAAAQKAAKTKRNRGLQSAALGVGFPLLFGGGAGSIAGGLLGSAGGFGGQILGSAIGQQIDNAVQSIAKLGQALDPLTADVEALTKAAGLSGTQTEKLIKRLEELGNAEAALNAATARLAQLVGQQGVDALKEFGEDSVELGNEISRALTVVGAAVAELINRSGLLKRLVDGIAFDTDLKRGLANRGNDAELSRLFNERGNPDLARIDANTENVQDRIRALDEAIVLRQRELDLESAITGQKQTQAQIEAQINANNAPKVAALQAELDLKESGLDLTTQEGFQLAIILKSKQLDAQTQAEIGKGVSAEVQQLRRKLAMLDLVNQRKEEQRRKDEEARREAEAAQRKAEAAAKKARQNTAALLAEQNKLYAVDIKITQATEGRAAAIVQELENLEAAYTIDAQRIILSTEDRALAQAKVNTLAKEYELKQILLRQEYASIQQQKEILKLKQQQALAGISTDIGRQIQDANFRGTGNAAQDEQLQLRIEQTRRAEDVTRQLTDAIAEQQAIINNPANADQAMRAEEQRQNLQDQLDLYNQLLPQLNQAEQAQLRYNQVLQAAQPYAEAFANGLTQGLRDVVAGTKTAEEAFADFLNNIADLLIQTASTMIAQYIAIGIARAFAGLGSPVKSKPTPPPAPNGTQIYGGQLINNGIFAAADGAYVTRPTTALIGEGGEPEYVIPASKMNESMARYSAGSRGNSVVPNNATGGGNGPSPAGAGAPLFNLQTQVINNVEYATVADVRAMGAQATTDGAKQGEARVMSSLKNSRARRSKLGL